MKKKYLFSIIFFSFVNIIFSQNIRWSVKEDTDFYIYIDSFTKENIKIKKGEILKPDKSCYFEREKNRLVYVLYENKIGEVVTSNTNIFFASEILNENKIILPYYNFDILYKKDRTLFKKLLEKDFYILSGEYYTEQESYEYFIENSYKRYLAITNAIIDLATNVEQNCILFIENINKIENGYECKGFFKYDFDNVDYLSLPFIGTPISGNHTLLIIYDGDYINVYEDSRDKLIMTYAITDENTLKEFNNLLKTGSYDLSKVTWPRHADGSCDY